MATIKQLSKQLADMIAAGEVVERPASVVKELVENAFDANAAAVTVEIRGGGLTFIRISDNGGGIERADVATAFLRHATSKLRDADGLAAIGTLGFRGEALAAIASVSRIETVTRATNEDEGTRIMLDGGEVELLEPAARPAGTTITVRDLFYNTPARQKFMKSDRAEAAAVTQAVIRLALSRPDISVRYLRDGTEELYTPGDARHDSCVYAALGREFASGMVDAVSETDGVTVRGFVSTVEALRGNRNYQFFFINGRNVKSRTLQAALEQAYRNRMFAGRFPACVLYVTLGYSQLDVNVHPAKTEVRFLYEKQVFDAVYHAALNALDGYAAATEPDFAAQEPVIPVYSVDKRADYAQQPSAPKSAPYGNYARQTSVFTERRMPDYGQPAKNTAEQYYAAPVAEYAESVQPELPDAITRIDFRVIGESMDTYIIVESQGSLWLIDKHAAHERMHFDRLMSGKYDPMPQLLITPVVVKPGGDGAELLLENAKLLETLGFAVEPFGQDAVAVRQIPSAIDIGEAEGALCEIERELRLGASDGTRPRDEIYASVACRAAIKAGRGSAPEELEYIADRVMRGEVRFCPHGRPVAVEITKSFIDKSFRRV